MNNSQLITNNLRLITQKISLDSTLDSLQLDSPLSIPLSFFIALPHRCSATVRGHGHVGLFS